MFHAYKTALNKKVQGVYQYTKAADGSLGDCVAEFESIAKASRETGIPEHEIRYSCKGEGNSKGGYLWCHKDPEKAKEWSKKFSSKHN